VTWQDGYGNKHDLDYVKRLATATALPLATPLGNNGTVVEIVPSAVGKVTPVRYDSTEGSGQEKNGAHICARF
jgi:hypothetical protein